jgi:hypothetical protein
VESLEADSDYQTYLKSLSPDAQATLIDQVEFDDDDDWPEERKPAFCMVVCLDGEVPTLETFHTAEELAERMQGLVSEDAYVFPFLGIPLPFTEAPTRVLFLPDDTAVAINAEGRAAIDAAADHAEDILLQEDYFLGPPELRVILSRTEPEKTAEEPSADTSEEPAAN